MTLHISNNLDRARIPMRSASVMRGEGAIEYAAILLKDHTSRIRIGQIGCGDESLPIVTSIRNERRNRIFHPVSDAMRSEVVEQQGSSVSRADRLRLAVDEFGSLYRTRNGSDRAGSDSRKNVPSDNPISRTPGPCWLTV